MNQCVFLLILHLKLKLSGAYISAHNKDFRSNCFKFKKNFKLLGSSHNLFEVNIKKLQNVLNNFLESNLFEDVMYVYDSFPNKEWAF